VISRILNEADLAALPAFLDEAFSGTRDATHYTRDVVGFFARWLWDESPVALVLEDKHGLVAASLGCERAATWKDEVLRTVHLGPIAVRPDRQRQGIGAQMLADTQVRARDLGADLLTLTANSAHGPHRLYAREGFRVTEAYRPLELSLAPGSPPSTTESSREVGRAEWESSPRPQQPRPGAIAEPVTRPAWIPKSLVPRWFLGDGAGVATLRWPIISRSSGQTREINATQIVQRWGDGPPLFDAIGLAANSATQDRSMCLYALPSVAEVLPGFQRSHSPLIYRMSKPISPAGITALAAAVAWDECCPAP